MIALAKEVFAASKDELCYELTLYQVYVNCFTKNQFKKRIKNNDF
jgi:hypothetical protein